MSELLPVQAPGAVLRAVARLEQGQVVVLPTDTVYGLAAHALRAEAIAALFRIKRRPADKPIALLVSGPQQVRLLASHVSPLAERLMEAFWPGALTLVLPRGEQAPAELGGRGVAVRMPASPVVLEVLQRLGAPLAASSANLSGGPDPRTAQEVQAQLQGRVALILDGGPATIGRPSTVVDLTRGRPRVLRPGPVSEQDLARVMELSPEELAVDGAG